MSEISPRLYTKRIKAQNLESWDNYDRVPNLSLSFLIYKMGAMVVFFLEILFFPVPLYLKLKARTN